MTEYSQNLNRRRFIRLTGYGTVGMVALPGTQVEAAWIIPLIHAAGRFALSVGGSLLANSLYDYLRGLHTRGKTELQEEADVRLPPAKLLLDPKLRRAALLDECSEFLEDWLDVVFFVHYATLPDRSGEVNPRGPAQGIGKGNW